MLVPVPCSVGNVKLLTLTPSSLFSKFKEDVNMPTHLFEKSWETLNQEL